MDKAEACAVLHRHLASYRSRGYADLAASMGQVDAVALRGPSGALYQIEVEIRWDDKPRSNLRVLGAIDDGGLRTWMPICEDFIIAPDGSSVGE